MLRIRLLGRKLPPVLYHYTPEMSTVLNIGNSRILRATCALDLDDTSEIRYGVQIIRDEVSRTIRTNISPFSKLVLGFIAEHVEGRASFTFMACFCAEEDSSYHWKNYGAYRLGFSTNGSWNPMLVLAGTDSYTQYFRVIYRSCVQTQIIRKAISEIVGVIDIHTRGEPSGPCIPWLAKSMARDLSQLLFDLVISFKNKKFQSEREWRIVCRPKLALTSTAPSMADENFVHRIRPGTKKFIELTTPSKSDWPSIVLRPIVPFFSVMQGNSVKNGQALIEITKMLIENGRPDISVK